MTYDFDEIIPRRGTNSYKWDSAAEDDILPMWVADMDFRTVPAVTEALRRRVEHGIFGYTRVPDSYYESIINWFGRRHGWKIEKDWILYCTGVVPAISAIIKAMTEPGDKVLIQGPVYNCFYSSISNNGCKSVSSPLIYEHNTYRMDFEDLELKASDPAVKLALLCNPHNPAGRVWTREELARFGEICLRHGVTIVSDEIHCELTMPGYTYTPLASVSPELQEKSIVCCSPSKSFNIAGLQIANIICADADIRNTINNALSTNKVCDVNPFGVEATPAAYSKEGEEWLIQLMKYIQGNYEYMTGFCREHLPDFPVTVLEGTYLAWMNCRCLGMKSEQLERKLLEETGLQLNAGIMYGPEGEGFMRWNLACPRANVEEGLRRFFSFTETYRNR